MRFLKVGMKKIILEVDLESLKNTLKNDPSQANKKIRCGLKPNELSDPLHYICDCVFENKISDEDAQSLAMIFLSNGAHVDGNKKQHMEDTPLLAACSLHADSVALLYIDRGADIHHQGCYGGTSIHWAAWTGADIVVERLLQEDIDLNKRCENFSSTPLFWGFHGYKTGGQKNKRNQYRCCELLLKAGADKTIPNDEGLTIKQLLNATEDADYLTLLNKYN